MPISSEIDFLDFGNTEIAFSNKTDRELKNMARLFRSMNSNFMVEFGSRLTLFAMKARIPLTTTIIENTIFKQFCGGRTLLECQPVIDKLFEYRCLTILDYGVEGKESEEEFNDTAYETTRAIDFAASNASVPVVSTKFTGLVRFSILQKIQEETPLNESEQSELKSAKRRIDKICSHAEKRGVGIMVDAEESWIQEAIDDLVVEMQEAYNKQKAVVYNTYQLYRHDKLAQLKEDYQRGKKEGYFVGAKLVRGAYMEKERKRAKDKEYTCPIHENKAAVDKDYNEALSFCIDHYEDLASVNASHNLESNRLQAERIDEHGIHRNHPHLNFCQLYGMSDYITFNLAKSGYNVAKYVPYGPIKDIIPYLIRRARENTAVTGDMSREYELIHKELKRRGIR